MDYRCLADEKIHALAHEATKSETPGEQVEFQVKVQKSGRVVRISDLCLSTSVEG